MEMALGRPGMHSVVQERNVRHWVGMARNSPKTIKLLKQMLLWGVEGEKGSSPSRPRITMVRRENVSRKFRWPHLSSVILDGPLQNALALKWAITIRVRTEQPGWIPSSLRLGSSLEASCKSDGQNEPEVMHGPRFDSLVVRWRFSLPNGVFSSWSGRRRWEHKTRQSPTHFLLVFYAVRRGGCRGSQFPLRLSISINAKLINTER